MANLGAYLLGRLDGGAGGHIIRHMIKEFLVPQDIINMYLAFQETTATPATFTSRELKYNSTSYIGMLTQDLKNNILRNPSLVQKLADEAGWTDLLIRPMNTYPSIKSGLDITKTYTQHYAEGKFPTSVIAKKKKADMIDYWASWVFGKAYLVSSGKALATVVYKISRDRLILPRTCRKCLLHVTPQAWRDASNMPLCYKCWKEDLRIKKNGYILPPPKQPRRGRAKSVVKLTSK